MPKEIEKTQPEKNREGQNLADWLLEKYGLDFDQLNLTAEEKQRLLNLGADGLKRMVGEREADYADGRRKYRGQLITLGEKEALLRQLERLGQGGGGHWAEGENSIGKDRPLDWIEGEKEYLKQKVR